MTSHEDQLCTAAATKLIALLETSYLSSKPLVPLSSDELIQLSNLTLSEQQRLIESASRFLNVAIDAQRLRRELQQLEQLNDTRELEDAHLTMGAPLGLMRRLFGMYAVEFSRRRRLLGIGGEGNGRPKQCDVATEDLIWRTWKRHPELEERQRFLKVAEATQIDLHLIWSTLRDHVDP